MTCASEPRDAGTPRLPLVEESWCSRKRMVLDSVGTTVDNAVESQLPMVRNEADF
jgi:hypothetical protein